MKAIKRLKKAFFILTVKSPITVMVIIAFIAISLFYISATNYTNVYSKAQGKFLKEAGKEYICATFNKKDYSKINTSKPVIFYFSNNGTRYDGRVSSKSSVNSLGDFNVLIEPLKDCADSDKHKKVTIEIQVKKIKIIQKLTMKAGDI
jgi:hypothetical protein